MTMAEKIFCSPLHFSRFAFLVGLLCLMAACGGEDRGSGVNSNRTPEQAQSSQTGAGAVDPCALVTGDEASQVLGAPAGEAERPPEANNPFLATCRYVAPRGQSVVVLVVMVHSREMGKRGFQTAKEQPFDIQAVTGVGDDAFWIGVPLDTLYILKDDAFFTIGGDIQLDQARMLADKALERL